MSIFAWYGYEGSLVKRAGALKQAGFSSLSLWWEREDNRPPKENLKILRRLEMNIDLVHIPYFSNGLWADEKGFLEESFLEVLQELHEAEIPRAVFHPTTLEEIGLPVSPAGLELAHRLFYRSKELGIGLLVENLQRDPHLFILVENIDFGLCLDTGHLGISGNYERLRKYFHRIEALHLHDNDGKTDLHLIPGDGILPLNKWLRDVPRGVEYHLEINRGLSDFYNQYSEMDYLHRAKKSLYALGGRDEKEF